MQCSAVQDRDARSEGVIKTESQGLSEILYWNDTHQTPFSNTYQLRASSCPFRFYTSGPFVTHSPPNSHPPHSLHTPRTDTPTHRHTHPISPTHIPSYMTSHFPFGCGARLYNSISLSQSPRLAYDYAVPDSVKANCQTAAATRSET